MSAHAAPESDVVILGAGIAGLSAAILLGRAGFRVSCIDPEPFPRNRVGESLDWSAPSLLNHLGLPTDELVAAGAATFKREVRATASNGVSLVGRPPPWVQRWPLRFEHSTVHLDRGRFDHMLYEKALDSGVNMEWDAVNEIVLSGDRVRSVTTRTGRTTTGKWFIDATGRRRILGRKLEIDPEWVGTPRISLWSRVIAPMAFDGTLLCFDSNSDELTWTWVIPVTEDRQSIGVVTSPNRYRALRREGQSKTGMLRDEFVRLSGLEGLANKIDEPARIRSYRPFVSARVCGSNWMLTGESAAFVDPLTSIGVTSAMRHASEAAQVIISSNGSRAKDQRRLSNYDRRTRSVAHLYNQSISRLMYEAGLRRARGIRSAARAYVIVGYGANSIYTRLKPTTVIRSLLFFGFLRGFQLWVRSQPTS